MNWKLFALTPLTLVVGLSAAKAQPTSCDECFAVIQGDGELARFSGATSAVRTGEGRYRVQFEASIAECAYNATIAPAGAQAPPTGEITVHRLSSANDTAVVRTYDSGGAADDRPFHLTIECPQIMW